MLPLKHPVVDVAVICSDFDESVRFYRDLLGLEVALDIEIPEATATGARLAPRGFRQLRLQREGLRGLERPDVADELKLSEEQQTKIGNTLKAARESQSGQNNRRRRRELSDEQKAQLLELLTDDQKAGWEKMRGDAFEFPSRQRFGRGLPGQD